MMEKKLRAFWQIAAVLNRMNVIPLLYGSLGLSVRLQCDLQADDIDILIPEIWLHEKWNTLAAEMHQIGYVLCDLHEHAFRSSEHQAAFAELESLAPFAGIRIERIPEISEEGIRYLLLTPEDYLRVYTASAKDGYRKNIKHKNDCEKIRLLRQAAENRGTGGAPYGDKTADRA